MSQVTFTAKMWRAGTSTVLTVPHQYLKDKVLDDDAEYEVTLRKKVEA